MDGNVHVVTSLKEGGSFLREEIKNIADDLQIYKNTAKECTIGENVDRNEMIANIMLAYRHLEDARMRIGKCLQAYQGGVSILDK
jgi:hypothetical protein